MVPALLTPDGTLSPGVRGIRPGYWDIPPATRHCQSRAGIAPNTHMRVATRLGTIAPNSLA